MKTGRPRFFSQRISLLRVFLFSALLSILAFATSSAWVLHSVREDIRNSLPSVADLGEGKKGKITRFLSSDGKLVATFFRENYKPITFNDLGKNVTRAVVAIEDRRFYRHDGVDYRGIVRAAVGNLQSGRINEGASTITMQLARSLYLTDDRSIERKVKEALLAQKIEKSYGKEEILERYLNEVYFGAGAHGIGAASARYFQKSPKELTIAQSAMLAGLIQSPTHLNPLSNLSGTRHRQVQVLSAMRESGFITSLEHHQAVREAAQLELSDAAHSAGQPMLKYPYFTSFAAKTLVDQLGEEQVYDGGLTVVTTLDRAMQDRTRRILQQTLSSEGPRFGVRNGAVVVIENRTGYLKALVGGQDWVSGDRFNRAWQAERQAGSTFKPILFAAALEGGATQDTIVEDKKITLRVNNGNGTFSDWTPRNSGRREYGKMPLRDALRLSNNRATVNLFRRVGLSRLLDAAERLGIKSELPRVPSLALGSGLVTPLELAETFSTFANQGVKKDSTAVTLVKDSDGKIVSDLRHAWSYQATSPEVARQISDMLFRAVHSGTGGNARVANIDVAGKTGTTDSFRDAWFVGYTSKYTVCVWMGNDDNTPTRQMYGGDLPALVWKKVVESLDHRGENRFAYFSESPHKRSYCKVTHKVAGDHCKKSATVSFRVAPPETAKCETCKPALIDIVKTAVPAVEQQLESLDKQMEPDKQMDLMKEQIDLMEISPGYPVAH